jgi:hypothetical protein
MLAHSPPLPLIIDYVDRHHDITAEDEEGILLALQHHDRVRRIRFILPIPALQKIFISLGKGFSILEFLHIAALTDEVPNWILPETFQAPQLRHLMLMGFVFPITAPFFTTAIRLVTLRLSEIPSSSYFRPSALLDRLCSMPQLESLGIFFHSSAPDHEDEEQFPHTPNMSHVTLLRLRWFGFRGGSAYLEALLPRMTIPALEEVLIFFFDQPFFSVPHLRQFANARKDLTASRACLVFNDSDLLLAVYSDDMTGIERFYMGVACGNPHKQVASVAQISKALGTILSGVWYLIIKDENHVSSLDGDNEADRTQWRDLLKSFENVKAIKVPHGLIRFLTRSLQSDDGESPVVFLPQLESLEEYSEHSDADAGDSDAFTAFIDARRDAGHPLTLVPR